MFLLYSVKVFCECLGLVLGLYATKLRRFFAKDIIGLSIYKERLKLPRNNPLGAYHLKGRHCT